MKFHFDRNNGDLVTVCKLYTYTESDIMLDIMTIEENIWKPPEISDEDMLRMYERNLINNSELDGDYLIFVQVIPYIDVLYLHYVSDVNIASMYKKRFVFHDGYRWQYEDEMLFEDKVLNNKRINVSYSMEEVYRYYSEKYPDWKLKRYYTNRMRLLDHIYHCMQKGTTKEILYKAGLDELASGISDLDEINLLSSKPSDIYDGISIRTLRSLNCHDGAVLLATADRRQFIKELQMKFPNIFRESLNDAQCRYLNYLIDGKLTVGETGRLFNTRRTALMSLWAPSQYEMFIYKEELNMEITKQAKEISEIDLIYKDYFKKIDLDDTVDAREKLKSLRYYLILHREEYDKKIRRSNRKRNQEWQERDKGYVVRYPQTINDFCRESTYMCNCLLTYVDAYIENDTTILLIRKVDDYNAPFITMEVFNGELMQAYHRFNEDCTTEEAQWIREYCNRHKINQGEFKFNNDLDELF